MTKKKPNRQKQEEVGSKSSVDISRQEKSRRIKASADKENNKKFSEAVNGIRQKQAVQMLIQREHFIKDRFSQLLFMANFRIQSFEKRQSIWQTQVDLFHKSESNRFTIFLRLIDLFDLKEAFQSVNPDFWGKEYSRRLTHIKRLYKSFQNISKTDIYDMKAQKLMRWQ